MMKIVTILDKPITSGGVFNQSLNAILQIQKICKGRFELLVMTNIKDNILYLKSLGIKSIFFRITLIDYLFIQVFSLDFFRTLTKYFKWISPFEKLLLKQNTSLIYFVTSSSLATILQKINYIITVYDLCHRDTPEFPEVRDFNSFHSRERLFQSVLGPAAAILTDSRTLADKITKRYGIDHERLLPMPFSPSPFLKNENSIQTEDVLLKYKLQSGYFFYPAQFWPHKNHIRILEAVLILRKNSIYPTVVFVGGDKGNLTFIHKLIHKHELDNQVKILGFIPPEDMAPLYESCKAVVMPSYFGSTNIPPLEAWMLGKPLIYTSYFQEQSGDAALLVDPNEANDIAEAMKQCFNQQICNDLVEKGYNRLQDINKQRDAAENTLLEILLVFEKKIRCWEDL